MTKDDAVLRILRMAGRYGVLNIDLANYSLRYGACIHRLRGHGHNITTKRVTQGLTRYVLMEG